MPSGWWWLLASPLVSVYGLVWVPLKHGGCFQVWTARLKLTQPRKPHSILASLPWWQAQPNSEKGNTDTTSRWEECQSHDARRACGMGDAAQPSLHTMTYFKCERMWQKWWLIDLRGKDPAWLSRTQIAHKAACGNAQVRRSRGLSPTASTNWPLWK